MEVRQLMKEKSKRFKKLPETYPDLKIGLNDSLADFGTHVIHSFLSLAPKKQDKGPLTRLCSSLS